MTDRVLASANSWDEFFKSATALPASAPGKAPDKGKVFERLTQLYLKTHPEYQTKLMHVWRAKDELPSAVRARIGLPKSDEGIDLVAETFEGDLWAVQCKFRADTRKPLTVGELATFVNLSFNVCRNISLAVVAHTCAKPVRKATLLGRATEIGLDRWLELDEEDWRRMQAATRRSPPPPKPRAPRPHQQRAIAAARKHFLEGGESRGRLLMPCGTGKSLTAFWIAEALKARSILVAVPSLHLIKQSLGDWTREFLARGEVPEWLCVCGDESTGRLERDEFVSGSYELGVSATTDAAEIERFLARKSRKRKVVFATYQSGKNLAAAARARKFRFDLGILDEAHRTVGEPTKSFGHLLPDANIAIAQRLFMTATERVVRGADEDVLSMDDERVYGRRFHQLSFKEAIEAQPPILSDYKILTITVGEERVKKLIDENRYLRTADSEWGEREAQSLAAGIALQRAFQEEGVRHAISFHRSIRAAEAFREQQERMGTGGQREENPVTFHISSQKSAGERADLLREFRQSPSALVTNARCLQEGVDIPAVDCILFADPKQSVVDIVQAAGRAMRPWPGKRFGYILVPIVVPSGMEFAEFAETTAFKQVGRVITALSTQDDRIAEEFRGVTAKDRRRNRERIVEIRGDMPLAQHIELQDFREHIRLKLWERVGKANWRPFEEARAYAQQLALRNVAEWRASKRRKQLPHDIPGDPHSVYKGVGWLNYGDWLGTGIIAPRLRNYRTFEAAREFARHLALKSESEWRAFCKEGLVPANVPWAPQHVYKGKGWIGFGDWLGTGCVAPRLRNYKLFNEARAFARKLGLRNAKEWKAFAKGGLLPPDVPATPHRVYKNKGWRGYGDWLGTQVVATFLRKYRAFQKARAYVHKLGIKSFEEWITYCKSGQRPDDIPSNPNRVYRNLGWTNLGDWLGTGIVAPRKRRYRPFAQAQRYARRLGLKSAKEWFAESKQGKLPLDIPSNPDRVYRNKGWRGFGDWLGTETIATCQRKYKPFGEARQYARRLRLTSQIDWRAYAKSGNKPADIPSCPNTVYREQGWGSWDDWLGTGKPPRKRKADSSGKRS